MSVAGKDDNNIFLPTAELYQEECKKAGSIKFLESAFFWYYVLVSGSIGYLCTIQR